MSLALKKAVDSIKYQQPDAAASAQTKQVIRTKTGSLRVVVFEYLIAPLKALLWPVRLYIFIANARIRTKLIILSS